jgi:CDP-diacylglycerol---glycerol-3-phosphate 3-phosphatidyltransferase
LFDGNFRTGVDRATKPVGRALVRLGITADRLTVLGVCLGIACCFGIALGHLFIGFLLLVAAGLPDLLDGPVAKAAGTQSIRGEFFDSVSDRITDSFVMGGLAWYLQSTHHGNVVILPVALLGVTQILSYMRAKAEIHGFNAKGGLMERAERVVVLCVGLVFSSILVPVLAIMLVLSSITVVQRFAKVWRQATDENPVLAARRRETPPWARNLFAAWSEADERRRRRWRERSEQQRQARRQARR